MATATKALLARLIDDAGQFPPARKPIEQALADYFAAKETPHGWILGRFLCPASKVEEVTLPRRLGVVADGDDWEMDLDAAVAAEANAFELRDPGPDAYAALAAAPLDVFVENATDLDALHEHQLGAKIRCGGLTADAFPSDAAVAEFVRGCVERGVAFKATAGLHHPFRTRDEEIGVLQHGFLNLLAATAAPDADTDKVIAERDPAAFELAGDAIGWRGVFGGAAEARAHFTGQGSCSFSEPVDDLVAHGILGAAAARA